MGEETGKNELQEILNCLRVKGYDDFTVEEAGVDGYFIANFKKDIKYSDKHGEYINDRYITIKIEFDRDFDYKNEDIDYDINNAENFVDKLINRSYGGSRKKLKKHKKNTRKNKKK
jgi:hypothetical protein